MSEISTPPRKRPRRLPFGGLLVGAAVALAGGAAAALLIVPADRSLSRPPVPGQSGPLRLVAASEVLARASERASGEPELDPEPGQYLYFERRDEHDLFSRRYRGKPPWKAEEGVIHKNRSFDRSEIWYPVGGQSPGFMRLSGEIFEGPWPGELTPFKDSGPGWICESYRNVSEAGRKDPKVEPDCKAGDDHYRDDLPTDTDGMYERLYAGAEEGALPPDVSAFRVVGDVISGYYLPPKSRAALFSAAARIPGTTVTRDVTDLADRVGIAVGQTWGGVRHELIFDPVTFAFFGKREIVDHDDSFEPAGGRPEFFPPTPDPELAGYMKPGHVLRQSVDLRIALVDERGQRP